MIPLQVQALRLSFAAASPVTETLAPEAPLRLLVNEIPFTVTMRTPGDERALARGLLLTEGIIPNPAARIEWREERASDGLINAINASLSPAQVTRSVEGLRALASSTSCGLCGVLDVPSLTDLAPPIPHHPSKTASFAALHQMFAAMSHNQSLFQASGGSHAAALFDSSGALLSLAEDVGRHNAVDKAIGRLILAGTLPLAASLLVSGRVSFEIVLKAWRAGVPVLAAVSAPTSLAVSSAAQLGIALLGFCRDGRAVAYAHPERLTDVPPAANVTP